MNFATPFAAAIATTAALSCTAALAQDQVPKAGVRRCDTHSKTSGLVTDPAVPALAGSGAETGDATTVILAIERTLTPNIGSGLVLGWPLRIDAEATRPLGGLTRQLGISNTVLSAKNGSPTLLVDHHFGVPSNAWRPHVGGKATLVREHPQGRAAPSPSPAGVKQGGKAAFS